jgi:hypothetical protein
MQSSRRDRQRGQVLLVFAFGLVAFLAVAALVFDVGQNLLDWRTQRDAADAAALAGARYIADPDCIASPSIANCPQANDAAIRVAALNGYGSGPNLRGTVEVTIPPGPNADPVYAGQPGFLQVTIHTDRPSFFAAVLGVLRQNVDALAVAGNSPNIAPAYSMLALNPDCDPNPSGQVNGNGSVDVLNGGSVVVNSDCDGALQVGGNAILNAAECDVNGTAQTSGSNAEMNCDELNQGEGFGGTGDPLLYTQPGPMPGTPADVEILKWNGSGTPTIPPGCPGSTVAITFVDDAIAVGDSAALPLFAGGDLAVIFAYRTGSNTPPSLPPTDWTNLLSDPGADNNSRRIGYRVLHGSETSTGTWANATALEVIIVRGQDTTTPIGVRASGGSAGTTMTSPALSGMQIDGHSWVIAFAGATSGANATTLSGANITALSSSTSLPPTPSSLALHYAANRINWPSQDYGGAVVGPNRTDAVEIVANPNPSTAANPAGCTLSGAGGGKYNVFRIHPGTYFGGISFKSQARVYMAPGTYWLAGGGFTVNAKDAQVISVNGSSSTTPGRGVFIYDTEDTYYHDQCVLGTAPAGACIGDIHVNGTSSDECTDPPQPDPYDISTKPTQPCQWIHLEPATSPVVPVTNLLIFVDRLFTGVGITFNGGAGKLDLAGTLYDPWGEVQINGGAGDSVAAQIIAYTFQITGNGGFTVTYDAAGIVHLSGAGLVQ